MKVITPYNITETVLSSSTINESEYPLYSPSTTYALGDKRIYNHIIYESLQASNLGHTPDTSLEWWLDTGATNKYRMFDQKVGTATEGTGAIVVEITTGGSVTSVALLELSEVTQVIVTQTDPVAGVVYTSTVDLNSTISVPSFWHYFFDPLDRKSFAIFSNLPVYKSSTIKIELIGAGDSLISCGVCIVGTTADFADAVNYGAKIGIQDFSRKEKDDFGNYSVVERAFSKTASWNLVIPYNYVDFFVKTMSSLRAIPALYVGSSLYDSTIIYGFPSDWAEVISYKKYSECSVEIEGLI